MESIRYDILRREDHATIWLESLTDLHAAKSRIQQIVSFWPGRYDVIENQSQRVVATMAPSHLHAPLTYIRERLRKSFWISHNWLLAPAPVIAGLSAYTHLQRYAQDRLRASREWLSAPVSFEHKPLPSPLLEPGASCRE
jgi:hypothetical protein